MRSSATRKATVLVIAIALLVAMTAQIGIAAEAGPSRKIVVFEQGTSAASGLRALARLGATSVRGVPLIGGAIVTVPDDAVARALERHPAVAWVEDDAVVHATAKGGIPGAPPKDAPDLPPQVIPWGVKRIGSVDAWQVSTGVAIKVAILDTGIDYTHPDLAANVKGGIGFVTSPKRYKDDNGHGTHVAGTVAAINDSIGVVGVAPEAHLYAVKVLDRTGSGFVSDVILGLEWAASNDMDVANMSLGLSSYSEAFEIACAEAYDAGVLLVAAAGNSGPEDDTVEYPARYGSVIAVSAIDSADVIASFSSRGDEVELAAPGVAILSTYLDEDWRELSGTSMAAPHVAGVAALIFETEATGSTFDTDSDGIWQAAEVRAKLSATAEDLGDDGRDPLYGFGIVDAYESVF